MKTVRIICLIVSFLVLTVQAVRHVYVKYYQVNTSALDAFEKTEVNQYIEEATLLEQLVKEYAPARKRTDQLNENLEIMLKGKSQEERWPIRTDYQNEHREEYRKERLIRAAIMQWEAHAEEIRELRVFWVGGLILFAVGVAFYFKWQWLGMAFIIPGVIEMIWWTSPDLSWSGGVLEFERLLTNRLVFTIITLVLLTAAWIAHAAIERRKATRGEA